MAEAHPRKRDHTMPLNPTMRRSGKCAVTIRVPFTLYREEAVNIVAEQLCTDQLLASKELKITKSYVEKALQTHFIDYGTSKIDWEDEQDGWYETRARVERAFDRLYGWTE